MYAFFNWDSFIYIMCLRFIDQIKVSEIFLKYVLSFLWMFISGQKYVKKDEYMDVFSCQLDKEICP